MGAKKLIKYPEDLRKIKDRPERLLMAIMDGKERFLNNNDFTYLEKVKAAFKMFVNGQSEFKVKRKLVALGYNNAQIIIDDVRFIFADINKVNPAFERIIQRERLLRHIKKAEKAGEWKAVDGFEKTFAKITGTDNHTQKTINWNLIEMQPLVLTEDISVLNDKDQEDIDFDEAEILEKDE